MNSQSVVVKKKQYAAPRLIERGNIDTVTQVNKSFGIGDGYFLIIGQISTPIQNYS